MRPDVPPRSHRGPGQDGGGKVMTTDAGNRTTNILLSGVGGQGVILASYLLTQIAIKAGYDVKQNAVHGMSQRGGSVISHLRFGPEVHSPLISPGEADMLISLEALEALRYLPQLKAEGTLVYLSLIHISEPTRRTP